ncbi:MAG: hypothetical protein ABSG53_34325 [Thermoguttaceae bacterium]|jgi:hypothetical protein
MIEVVKMAITNGWTRDHKRVLYHFEHLTQRQAKVIEKAIRGLHVVETVVPILPTHHRNRYFLPDMPSAIRFAWEMERGEWAEYVVSIRPALDAERAQAKVLVRYFNKHPEAESISDKEVLRLSPG